MNKQPAASTEQAPAAKVNKRRPYLTISQISPQAWSKMTWLPSFHNVSATVNKRRQCLKISQISPQALSKMTWLKLTLAKCWKSNNAMGSICVTIRQCKVLLTGKHFLLRHSHPTNGRELCSAWFKHVYADKLEASKIGNSKVNTIIN